MNENKNSYPKSTPPHLFSLIDATRRAFIFIIEEKSYLARLSVPVISLQVFFSIAIFMFDKDATGMEMFLWGMPVSVFMGWFTFGLVRLAIFGERIFTLPVQDVRFMQHRARLMKATILVSILLKAFFVALAEVSIYFSKMSQDEVLPASTLLLALGSIALIFWAIRFMAFPLLFAVDYPIKRFMQQVRGFGFSLRLFGLSIMCAFPAFMLLNIFSQLIVQDLKSITDIEMMILLAVQAPFSVIISAFITAGMCFALKEMLGQSEKI